MLTPAAENYYAGALTLPLHPRLREADQDRIVSILERALVAASDV